MKIKNTLWNAYTSHSFKGLVLDFDGTLTEPGQKFVPEDLIKLLLEKIVSKQVPLAIISGGSMKTLLQELAAPILNFAQQKNLTKEVLSGIIFFSGLGSRCFTAEGVILTFKKIPEWISLRIVELLCINWLNFEDYYVVNEEKITIYRKTTSAAKDFLQLKRLLKNGKMPVNVVIGEILPATTIFIIVLDGCTKINACEQFYSMYNLENTDVMKVGDTAYKYGADYELLSTYGGVSVGELNSNNCYPFNMFSHFGKKNVRATRYLIEKIHFTGIQHE